MQQLRVTSPLHLTDRVVDAFAGPAVSQLAVLRGASIAPVGDIVVADVAREAVNDILDRLEHLGIPEYGTIHIEPVTTWISRAGLRAVRRTPGVGADSVVWADVTQRAYAAVCSRLRRAPWSSGSSSRSPWPPSLRWQHGRLAG